MKNKGIYEDLEPIQRKARLSFILVGALFIFLLLAFWKTQILDHAKYWRLSEANRIREITLPAQRGLIRDRNGIILATNIASFRAAFIRENCSDFAESCRRISALLGLEPEVLEQRIAKYSGLPEFHPVVIKDDLSLEEVSRIKARKREFPELLVEAEPKRNYPFGTLAAHVLGYLQEISPEERKGPFRDRRLGDRVGKTGMERQYEGMLVGREGMLLEVVDSMGRRMGEFSRRPPVPGQDVLLTLDVPLQKKAEELLEGREGAVVVLDPRNGEVLALASFPTFDPNAFINRFTPEEWMTLVNSPEFPLENRAIRGLYAPGSVFKPAVALGALDSGAVSEWTKFYCSGAVRIYGHPFSCWFRGGHGTVNLYSGIQHSCNVYFYQVGKRMGIETISAYARMLGLGRKTGIDLPGEKPGLVPDPEWKRRIRGEPWYPGETISVSIGQGQLLVTPLQVACYTALIANRGRRVTPHLSQQVLSSAPGDPVDIPESEFEKVIQGMWLSVNEKGTGRAARVPGLEVCGKTGSTQVVSTETADRLGEKARITKTHSWFTGFAPRTHPQIVVTVLVEYGGMGGATAAPLAGALFRFFRKEHDR